MTKRKSIIIDYDDVLVDYCKGVVGYAVSHYGLKVQNAPNSYNLHKTFNVTENLIDNVLHNFNNNSYQFGLLDVIDDYVKGSIWMLRKHHPDIDLFIVTKCGNSSKTVALRKVNCIHHFGEDVFEDMIFLNPNETKASAFKKIQKTHDVICVIDDHIDNINTAIECGIDGIVYERTHNKNYKFDHRYTFVESWVDIYHEIEKRL